MTTEKRKRYTTEFKQNAAQLVLSQGYSQKQAAESLGVSQSAIARWVIAAKSGQQQTMSFSNKPEYESQLEQIKLLKLENEQLRLERDILKKAAVILAEQ